MRPKQSRPEGGLPNSPEVRYAAFSGVLFLLDEPRSLRLRSRAASLPKLRVQNGVRCWMNSGKHLLTASISPFGPGTDFRGCFDAYRICANDSPTMLGAAVEGLRLAQVPEPIAAGAVKTGKLVRVLEPFAPMAPGVFLYYPGYRQMMPKLRAFINHVKSRSDTANKTLIHVEDGRTRSLKMR